MEVVEHMKGDARLGVQILLGEGNSRVKSQEWSEVWSQGLLWTLWGLICRKSLWRIPTRDAPSLAALAVVGPWRGGGHSRSSGPESLCLRLGHS